MNATLPSDPRALMWLLQATQWSDAPTVARAAKAALVVPENPEKRALRWLLDACTPRRSPTVPRDEELVYHGTSLAAAERIRAEGLRPNMRDTSGRGFGWVKHPGPFATRHPLLALYYGIGLECDTRWQSFEAGERYNRKEVIDFRCAVLTLRVPKSDRSPSGYFAGVEELWLPGGVSADRIVATRTIDIIDAGGRLLNAGIPMAPNGDFWWTFAWAARRAAELGLVRGEPATLERRDALRRNLPRLIRLALSKHPEIPNPPCRSLVHGNEHSKAVALGGLYLAKQIPGADPDFILAFAQLHDVMRNDDGDDPEHGERAAALFRELCGDPGLDEFGFERGSERTQALEYAIAHHNTGAVATDHPNVNVGICWDADRLNLWRVGIEPDPGYLTTEVARTDTALRHAWVLANNLRTGDLPPWSSVLEQASSQ